MNVRIALLIAPLALLAACSDDDPTVYTLSSGDYSITGATESPADGCLLMDSYTPDNSKVIGIAVDGAIATFNLDPTNAQLTSHPTATINGNSLELLAEANYTVNYGNCQVRVRRTVVGDLTANDATALQLHATVAETAAGTNDCDGTQYENTGCVSDLHFLATKVVAAQ